MEKAFSLGLDEAIILKINVHISMRIASPCGR